MSRPPIEVRQPISSLARIDELKVPLSRLLPSSLPNGANFGALFFPTILHLNSSMASEDALPCAIRSKVAKVIPADPNPYCELPFILLYIIPIHPLQSVTHTSLSGENSIKKEEEAKEKEKKGKLDNVAAKELVEAATRDTNGLEN